MKLSIRSVLVGLILLISNAEGKFGGGYVGLGIGIGYGVFKYKQPPLKTYKKEGTFSKMSPTEIKTSNSWEICNLSAVAGYGAIIDSSNYYFGGELRGNMKLMNSGLFIGSYNLIARLGYLPNDNILIYVGAGVGFTETNVDKTSDGNISYI